MHDAVILTFAWKCWLRDSLRDSQRPAGQAADLGYGILVNSIRKKSLEFNVYQTGRTRIV